MYLCVYVDNVCMSAGMDASICRHVHFLLNIIAYVYVICIYVYVDGTV